MRWSSLVERRARTRSIVYLVCSIIVVLFGLWSAEEGLQMVVPYAAMLCLLVFQFFRPTLLGWLVIAGLFGSYAIGVFVKASFREDYLAGLIVGIVPTALLLWARPRPPT